MDAGELGRVGDVTILEGIVRRHGVAVYTTIDDAYDGTDGFKSIRDQLAGVGIVVGAVGNGDEIKTHFFHQLHKHTVVCPMASLTGETDKDVFGGGCAGIVLSSAIHKMIACSHFATWADKGEAGAEEGAGDEGKIGAIGESVPYKNSTGEITFGQRHRSHDAF